jgi:hypothetical protein
MNVIHCFVCVSEHMLSSDLEEDSCYANIKKSYSSRVYLACVIKTRSFKFIFISDITINT